MLGQDNVPFYCICPDGFTGLICNETEKGTYLGRCLLRHTQLPVAVQAAGLSMSILQWVASPVPLPLSAGISLETPRPLEKLCCFPLFGLIHLLMSLLWRQVGPDSHQAESGQEEVDSWGEAGNEPSLGGVCIWAGSSCCACLCTQLLPDHLPILPAFPSPGPCFPNPCLNDAECQVIDDSHRGDVFTQYICECPHGYTGTHCETSEYLGVRALGVGGTDPEPQSWQPGPCLAVFTVPGPPLGRQSLG